MDILLAQLLSSMDRHKRLEDLTDKQLAKLLLDEVWADEDCLSYKSDIIGAAVDRLCGVKWDEEIDWDDE